MKISTTVIMIAVSSLAVPAIADDAYGTPFEGWGFVKDDWQLVCDNILTCRAAGYQDETSSSNEVNAASLLMTIEAGQKNPTAEIQLSNWDDNAQELLIDTQLSKTNNQVQLWLNNKLYGTVQLSAYRKGELSLSQTQELLKRVRQNTKIHVTSGIYQWQVSDAGMAAVLLKLDEAQGRVGTPLALVSKNSSNQQTPKRAKPIPKVYAAYAYPVSEYPDYELAEDGTTVEKPIEQKYYQHISASQKQQWQNKMKAWVMPTLNKEDRDSCNILTSDSYLIAEERKVWQFTPIDSKHTLVSHPCWTGAYNFGTGYWVINNDSPNKPRLITTSGSEYAVGEIFAAHKGRGLGDCWAVKQWIWNGNTFVKTSDKTTGLCRLISAGGAWDLPTYVSEVIGSTVLAEQ